MDDDAIRQMINAIDVDMPTEGSDPPVLESIGVKSTGKTVVKKKARKFYVQKLVTEIYILTDMDGKGVSEVVNQELYLLGNMTEAKIKRLIAAERAKHEEDEFDI